MVLYLVRLHTVLVAHHVNSIVYDSTKNEIIVSYNTEEKFTIVDSDVPNLNLINQYLDNAGFSFELKEYVLGPKLAFPVGASVNFFVKQ